MHSEYDFNFVKLLPYGRIIDLLIKSRERKNKSDAWDMWISRYPNMTKENFMTFNEFYEKLTIPMIIKPSDESIQDRFEKFMKE